MMCIVCISQVVSATSAAGQFIVTAQPSTRSKTLQTLLARMSSTLSLVWTKLRLQFNFWMLGMTSAMSGREVKQPFQINILLFKTEIKRTFKTEIDI